MDVRAAKQLALIVIAALALRLLAATWWHERTDGRFVFGDSQSYWVLAEQIAAAEPYQYGDRDSRIFRAPGYPLLLAPLFGLLGPQPSLLWARIAGAIFGTAAVAATWWLSRELFDAQSAVFAGWLAVVYPGAIATSVLVLSETAFCPLMVASLAIWARAMRASNQRRALAISAAAGLVGGAATLVRPSWLLFTPLAALLAVLLGKRRRRQLIVGAGLMVGLVVAMAPWWLRNAALTGRFVPTTLQVGASLYDGWNPRATGASNMYFMSDRILALRAREQGHEGRLPSTFEWRLDQSLRRAAWHWAVANPGAVVHLAGVKFVRMWNIWPNEPSFSRWPVRLLFAATYGPVLLLSLWGVLRTIERPWPYGLCWMPAVYFTALHLVFVSSIRYRQPAMLPLIVLAAGALVGWMGGRPETGHHVAAVGEEPGEASGPTSKTSPQP